MIFVTVGEQLPFDRLIRAVDQWASKQQREVFAQIGRSAYRPRHIYYKAFMEQIEFRQKMQEAQLIVAHAGMGTIITALEMELPIIVMPRRAAFGEHRNDHQIDTAKRLSSLSYVSVAFDEIELGQKLSQMENEGGKQETRNKINLSPLLIKDIRDFILN